MRAATTLAVLAATVGVAEAVPSSFSPLTEAGRGPRPLRAGGHQRRSLRRLDRHHRARGPQGQERREHPRVRMLQGSTANSYSNLCEGDGRGAGALGAAVHREGAEPPGGQGGAALGRRRQQVLDVREGDFKGKRAGSSSSGRRRGPSSRQKRQFHSMINAAFELGLLLFHDEKM